MNQSGDQLTAVSARKRTVVLGASNDPSRYSYQVVGLLLNKGLEPIPIGIRQGSIKGIDILNGQPELEDIHTVSLYLNPERQQEYYDYILGLKPQRIIFNPGTENPEFIRLAREHGIEVELGCSLVMLTVGTY